MLNNVSKNNLYYKLVTYLDLFKCINCQGTGQKEYAFVSVLNSRTPNFNSKCETCLGKGSNMIDLLVERLLNVH